MTQSRNLYIFKLDIFFLFIRRIESIFWQLRSCDYVEYVILVP